MHGTAYHPTNRIVWRSDFEEFVLVEIVRKMRVCQLELSGRLIHEAACQLQLADQFI